MYNNLPEVVISKSVSIINSMTAVNTKEQFIGKAAAYLRQDLLKFAEETNKNNHWPPTFALCPFNGSSDASINQSDTNITRTKAHKFTSNHVKESKRDIKIDPRASPPNVSTTGKEFQDYPQIAIKYFIWLLLRQTYGISV